MAVFRLLEASFLIAALRLFARTEALSSLKDPCEESFADPDVRISLSTADNIFFLHTSNETTLTDIQRCALASAARLNPTRRVNLFSNTHSCAYLRAAVGSGVHLVRHNPHDVYAHAGFTAMVNWYATRVWDMHYSGIHLSDSMRLALLHAFGGVYLDTDVLSLRPVDGLVNAVGLEDPWMINNAVLALSRGHAFAAQAAHEFVHGFSATWWGWNGPRLVTRVSRAYLGERSQDDVLLAPVEEFYPISWRDWPDFFAPAPPDGPWLDRLARSRLVHVWHSLVSSHVAERRSRGEGIDGLVLGRLLDAACPAGGPGAREGALADASGDGVSARLLAGGSVSGLTSAGPLHSRDEQQSCGSAPPVPDEVDGWLDTGVSPIAILSGGGTFTSVAHLSSAPRLVPVHADVVGLGGACVPQPCGLSCGSCGVGREGLHLSLPSNATLRAASNRSAWTLTLWLSTLALDSTLRDWPHHTPAVAAASLPADSLGIPSDIRVPQGSLPPELAAAVPRTGDVLVVAVEDGHATVGGLGGEWARSHSPIADGRWHHVAITFEPTLPGDKVRLSLAIDGVVQALRERGAHELALSGFVAVAMGARGIRAEVGPALFVDGLGVYAAALPHGKVVRLRNAQLLLAARRDCLPVLGWRAGLTAPASLTQPPPPPLPAADGARLLVIILSVANDAGAATRLVVRQTWVQLGVARLTGAAQVRHFFCLGGDGAAPPAPLRLEGARFSDIIYSGTPEAYERLSEKVMGCFRAATARADAEGAAFDFVVKTDHDVFLRVDTLRDELTTFLASAAQEERQGGGDALAPALLYWRGFAYRNVPPLRDLRDKNADINIPIMVFPPYTAGVGYVLSAALVRLVAALPAPTYSFNEDQAMGLWVLQAADEAKRRGDSLELEALEPVHDIRFQQWDVCNDDQLAVHPSNRRRQRLLAYNVRGEGGRMCAYDGASTCCFCCECDGMRYAWFVCDARGAWVPEFTTLSQLVGGNEWALLGSVSSARALADTVTALAAAPPAMHVLAMETFDVVIRGMASGWKPATTSPQSLSCAWGPTAWAALGGAKLTQAEPLPPLRAPRGDAAGSSGTWGQQPEARMAGISLVCESPPRSLPVFPSPAQSPAAPARALAPFCGASIDIEPPKGVVDCLRLRAEGGAGDLLQGVVETDASGAVVVAPAAPPRLCYDGGEPLDAYPRRVDWLLLTAVVSTVGGACELRGVNGTARDDVLAPAPGEDVLSRYPRTGSFRSFCGFAVDVVYADGRVEAFRSPFARGAARHLHYEVLSLTHVAPVHRVRVTLVVPAAPPRPVKYGHRVGASPDAPPLLLQQPVEVHDLTLVPVDVPPERALQLVHATAARPKPPPPLPPLSAAAGIDAPAAQASADEAAARQGLRRTVPPPPLLPPCSAVQPLLSPWPSALLFAAVCAALVAALRGWLPWRRWGVGGGAPGAGRRPPLPGGGGGGEGLVDSLLQPCCAVIAALCGVEGGPARRRAKKAL